MPVFKNGDAVSRLGYRKGLSGCLENVYSQGVR